ncbi:methyltransferase domain-containing protein [Herbidospora cretacea]|uniref:methyltransferase domain-containing protein n=1 Tax=Herbidospora cretacea TaxID=28444 RepID=UPI0007733CAB|nr:methyltransferase domain-containing protein [Herbidospora cretacea]
MAVFDGHDMRAYLERVSRHPMVRSIRDEGLALLDVRPGERVLDAGCGPGDMAARFADLGARVTAIDADPVMSGAAAEIPGVTAETADLATLDRPGHYDVVWAERLLQHVPDADRVIGNLVRSLAPGGRICLIDVDWTGLVVDGVDEELAGQVLGVFRTVVPHPSMGRTLRRRLARQGLAKTEVRAFLGVSTDLADATAVIPVLDERLIPAPPSWFAAVAEADRAGEFLTALPLYLVTGSA